MPRQRRYDPTIPSHIDQKKLPTGAYWNRRDRNWYTILSEPKPHRQRIAGSDALMSELNKAIEQLRGVRHETLDHMLGHFAESGRYKELASATRDDYAYCRLALQRYKTKLGCSFAELDRTKITTPLIQKLIDTIASTHPSKANHIKRYLSAAYKWGVQRGYVSSNPAKVVQQAKERKAHRMPSEDTMHNVIAFLRERGALSGRRAGAVASYVWAVAEIAYRLRLRSVEVRMLTDDSATDEGIIVVRTKGSAGNITRWSPELREAWSWLVARRARIWLKKGTPQAKLLRPLVVAEDGNPLSKSALNSAWKRAMAAAIEARVIGSDERFGLHGLKHRGVTDTPGTKADKKLASGHKSDAMVELYDHEVPTVNPAGRSRRFT